MAKPEENPRVENSAFEQALFAWKAPEFLRFYRGPVWHVLAFLIHAALVVYAYFNHSWSMALVFVILYGILLLHHRRAPREIQVTISAYGIQFGNKRMAYSEIRRFWILHEPPFVDELHLLTGDAWHPELTIPLMGVDPTVLRQYLVTQIPEWEGKKQSFLDILVRILRLG